MSGLGAGACREPHDLTVQQLSAVVDRERATLKPCYDAALAQHPYQQEMRFQVVIHVAPSGRVADVEIPPGSGLPGMADCLRKVIWEWRFPTAKDATDASLPLVFKPEAAPAGVPSLPNINEILQLDSNKPK